MKPKARKLERYHLTARERARMARLPRLPQAPDSEIDYSDIPEMRLDVVATTGGKATVATAVPNQNTGQDPAAEPQRPETTMNSLPDLAAALKPIANAALAATDPDVKKVSVILAAVMGCIAGPGAADREALDPLVISAGLICEHRSGRHAQGAR